MKLITESDLIRMLQAEGLERSLHGALENLEGAIKRWQSFHHTSRHVIEYPQGVLELMPCADKRFYSFKYVNGHPGNPACGLLSVVAIGLLAETETGYPVLMSEMTLLTAIRTAVTTALATRYLARPDSSCLAIIGTGSQAEFQVQALRCVLPLREIRFFDLSATAMAKFSRNLSHESLRLKSCRSVQETLAGADVIVTATAARRRVHLFPAELVHQGAHLNAMGGDSRGKTELDPKLLGRCKIVVEYLPQTRLEGEIQNRPDLPVHAELWELVQGKKPGRESDDEITLFDAVGYALEDYAILTWVHKLSERLGIYHEVDMIPTLDDPKNLYGLLRSP